MASKTEYDSLIDAETSVGVAPLKSSEGVDMSAPVSGVMLLSADKSVPFVISSSSVKYEVLVFIQPSGSYLCSGIEPIARSSSTLA